jgi:hypothetical protein
MLTSTTCRQNQEKNKKYLLNKKPPEDISGGFLFVIALNVGSASQANRFRVITMVNHSQSISDCLGNSPYKTDVFCWPLVVVGIGSKTIRPLAIHVSQTNRFVAHPIGSRTALETVPTKPTYSVGIGSKTIRFVFLYLVRPVWETGPTVTYPFVFVGSASQADRFPSIFAGFVSQTNRVLFVPSTIAKTPAFIAQCIYGN